MADYATRSPVDADRNQTAQQPGQQAKAAGGAAVEGGADVARTVKEQGRQVVQETGRQARGLYQKARSEVDSQARTQQDRAAAGLRALADEADAMAQQGGQSGPVTQFAHQASDQLRRAGQWLDEREPSHLINEVKSYARQHPAAFLTGAAILGVLAGRVVKNLASDSDAGSGRMDSARMGSGYSGNGQTSVGATVTPVAPASPVSTWDSEASTTVAGVQPADGYSTTAGRS